MKKNNEAGFTLLELLIVIGIIAILSVALVIVLNPAETLRKSRDAQRISDLATMKTALGIYITSVQTPLLNNVAGNVGCKATAAGVRASGGTEKVYYSYPTESGVITDATIDGTTTTPKVQVALASNAKVDGTGWVPVNFDSIVGGSPISNLPVDPTNTITSLTAVASTDLVYRYSCAISPLTFEMNAQLESQAYTVTENKRATDGGDNAGIYEVGTNLSILGAGADF